MSSRYITRVFLLFLCQMTLSSIAVSSTTVFSSHSEAKQACKSELQGILNEVLSVDSDPLIISLCSLADGDRYIYKVKFSNDGVETERQNSFYTSGDPLVSPAAIDELFFYNNADDALDGCNSFIIDAEYVCVRLGDQCESTSGYYHFYKDSPNFLCNHLYVYPTPQCPGEEPSIRITSPADNAVFEEGDRIFFDLEVSDLEDDDIWMNVFWSLNGVDFNRGAWARIDSATVGWHKIAARVTDSDGNSVHDQIRIRVDEKPPVICDSDEVLVGDLCRPLVDNPEIEDPNDGDPMCNGVGNPINVATGNKHHFETDFVALGEAPLSYSRFYNSRSGKWVLDPRSKIETFFINGSVSNRYKKRVDFIDVDGKRITFTSPNVSSVDDETLFVGSSFSATTPGMKLEQLTSSLAAQEYYKLTRGDRIYSFNAEGELNYIEFLGGVRYLSGGIRHTYSMSGDVLTVSHSNGSSIRITFDTYGSVQQVQDTWGNIYRYTYLTYNRNLLRTVVYPDPNNNPVKTYRYEDSGLRTALTGITDEEGNRYATWLYHPDSGKPFFSGHGYEGAEAFSYQPDPNEFIYPDFFEQTYIQYGEDAPDGLTRVFSGIDYDFERSRAHTYHFSEINGIQKITAIDGAKVPDDYEPPEYIACGPTNVTTTYDANGYEDLVTDARGIVTDYDYDSSGLLRETTEAVGTPEERTTSFLWHPDFYAYPSVITAPTSVTRYSLEQNTELANTYTEIVEVEDTSSVSLSVSGEDLPSGMNDIDTSSSNYAVPITYIDNEFYTGSPVLKTRTTTVASASVSGYLKNQVEPTTVENFNTNGQLVSRVSSGGLISHTFEYNPATPYGPPEAMIDVNGVRTEYTYHPRGWMLTSTVKAPDGSGMSDSVTTYKYYDNGLLEEVTYPNGYRENYEYDSAHRLVKTANNRNEFNSFENDDAFSQWTESLLGTQTSSGVGLTVDRWAQRVFDSLGRQRYTRRPIDSIVDDNFFEMEDANLQDDRRVRREIAANGSVISSTETLDSLGRVTGVLDPLSNTVSYRYDMNDNLIELLDQNDNSYTQIYDGSSRLLRASIPGKHGLIASTYWYNPLGLVTHKHEGVVANPNSSISTGSRTATYEYDRTSGKLNQSLLTGITYSDGEQVTYSYDDTSGTRSFARGRLYRIQEKNQTVEYDYDHLGNITREIKTIGSNQFVTQYRYNEASQLVQMIYPSGRVVDYQRSLGLINKVETKASDSAPVVELAKEVKQDPFNGPVTRIHYGSDMIMDADFNLGGQLKSKTVTDGTNTLFAADYVYNDFIDLTDINRSAADPKPEKSANYVYDDLHRLTDYVLGGSEYYYEYDSVGNRELRSLTVDGVLQFIESYDYVPATNQIDKVTRTEGTEVVERNFGYDYFGSVTSDSKAGDSKSLKYDHRNRLIEVRVSDVSSTSPSTTEE